MGKLSDVQQNRGTPPTYLSYERNKGKLYIAGKVIGRTRATMTYVGRISSDRGAPSGENLNFSKIAKLTFLPLGAPESLEMLLIMVFHLFVPISIQKYTDFLFSISPFFEKFTFSPLGAPPSLGFLPA